MDGDIQLLQQINAIFVLHISCTIKYFVRASLRGGYRIFLRGGVGGGGGTVNKSYKKLVGVGPQKGVGVGGGSETFGIKTLKLC